jgi:hypothetical protein
MFRLCNAFGVRDVWAAQLPRVRRERRPRRIAATLGSGMQPLRGKEATTRRIGMANPVTRIAYPESRTPRSARVSRPRRDGRPEVSTPTSNRETFGRRWCGVRRPAHSAMSNPVSRIPYLET